MAEDGICRSNTLTLYWYQNKKGLKKPQAEIFLRALERLDVSPEESVYVGDHPENDVIAARNVGMNAVWKKDMFWGNPFTDKHVIEDLKRIITYN
ncbi:hypothetical protein GCM10020331_007770 [Ectobacillus funiculus]